MLCIIQFVQVGSANRGPVSSLQVCMSTGDRIITWWPGQPDCTNHTSLVTSQKCGAVCPTNKVYKDTATTNKGNNGDLQHFPLFDVHCLSHKGRQALIERRQRAWRGKTAWLAQRGDNSVNQSAGCRDSSPFFTVQFSHGWFPKWRATQLVQHGLIGTLVVPSALLALAQNYWYNF